MIFSGCATEKGQNGPHFHWIEYTGQDPVFEQFQPVDGEFQNPIIVGFYPEQEKCNTLNENADGTVLSTESAGGFVGTFFGMYASTNDN